MRRRGRGRRRCERPRRRRRAGGVCHGGASEPGAIPSKDIAGGVPGGARGSGATLVERHAGSVAPSCVVRRSSSDHTNTQRKQERKKDRDGARRRTSSDGKQTVKQRNVTARRTSSDGNSRASCSPARPARRRGVRRPTSSDRTPRGERSQERRHGGAADESGRSRGRRAMSRQTRACARRKHTRGGCRTPQ